MMSTLADKMIGNDSPPVTFNLNIHIMSYVSHSSLHFIYVSTIHPLTVLSRLENTRRLVLSRLGLICADAVCIKWWPLTHLNLHRKTISKGISIILVNSFYIFLTRPFFYIRWRNSFDKLSTYKCLESRQHQKNTKESWLLYHLQLLVWVHINWQRNASGLFQPASRLIGTFCRYNLMTCKYSAASINDTVVHH